MSIRHGVGGEEYVIDKLTRRSTVEDVISRIVKDLKLDKGRWIILEVNFSDNRSQKSTLTPNLRFHSLSTISMVRMIWSYI